MVDPAAAQLDEGLRFPLCRPQPLHELFARAGLSDVEVRALDVAARFADWDDYRQPYLGLTGPAPSFVASLASSQQTELAAALRGIIPVAHDGSITLPLRAWAVRGTKP